jgi:LysM repeat protein
MIMKNFSWSLLAICFCLSVSCAPKQAKKDAVGIIDTSEHPLPQQDVDTITPQPVDSLERLLQYTVQPGDTLYSISRAHDMTVGELQSINKLSGTNIHAGQTLLVRGGNFRNVKRETIVHDLPVH